MVYVYPVEHVEWFFQDDVLLREPDPEERARDEQHMARYLREEKWKRQNLGLVLDEIETFRSHGRLLDLGCNCGFLLDLARARDWDVVGVEPGEIACRYAVEHLDLNVFGGTLEQAAFPPDTFDVVVSLQVFEHLLEPREILRQVTRVLKPGGLLVVEVPCIDNLGFRILGRRHRHFAQHHVCFFSTQTLTRLLTEAGYRVERIVYPARLLSLMHLATQVGGVDSPLATRLGRWIERLGLDTKSVAINLKDILRIYAVQTDTGKMIP
jgi:2-polyprenyl-3-methyl-5-hydroxy-6-metoxy-1,4-benzoquinol methylase